MGQRIKIVLYNIHGMPSNFFASTVIKEAEVMMWEREALLVMPWW